jgi:Flp pilus assembly protein TadG
MHVREAIAPPPHLKPGTQPVPKRRGASAVEFALVAPVAFVVILGMIEFGRGLMVQHLLNNASRAGCRTAALEGQTTANVNTVVTNALSSQGIQVQTQQITVAVNGTVADASTANPGDEITVTVSLPVSQITWLPGVHFLYGNIMGQYSLRRE